MTPPALRVLLFLLAALPTPALAAADSASCPAAPVQTLDLPVTRAAIAAGAPVVVVALGSSSTEGFAASAPDRTYPARLQAELRARLPGADILVLNRGRGGQTTREMLARLDADVLAAHPTLVIWQDGANEAVRGMDPAAFRTLVAEGVARLHAAGADVVLMDNQAAPRIEVTSGHGAFDAALAALRAKAVSVFSRVGLMRAWGAAAAGMIGPDGLHHTDRGYACVAGALADAILTALAGPSPSQDVSARAP